jgi:hypothetical protein
MEDGNPDETNGLINWYKRSLVHRYASSTSTFFFFFLSTFHVGLHHNDTHDDPQTTHTPNNTG